MISREYTENEWMTALKKSRPFSKVFVLRVVEQFI